MSPPAWSVCPEGEVLGDAQLRLDGVEMPGIGEALAIAVAIPVEPDPVERDHSRAGGQEPREDPQQRGFAGAVGAAQQQAAAVGNLEADAVEHRTPGAVATEALDDKSHAPA